MLYERKQWRWLTFIVLLVMSFLLIGFLCLPLLAKDFTRLNDLGAQRARVQRLAKVAVILSSRPESEHAQALIELQISLPALKTAHEAMQDMPATSEMKTEIVGSQAAYSALYQACANILANPKDKAFVTTVLTREREYGTKLTQIVTLYQRDIEARTRLYITIECTILILIIVLHITHFVLSERTIERIRNHAKDTTGRLKLR